MSAQVSRETRALWGLSRREAEELYVEAFRREDEGALRWLGIHDRYFLLTCLCGRADVRDDWVYARCREVEADPDDYLDLWAREHFKSTLITFGGIIQEILRDPEITVCIFSNDTPTAKKFFNQIKREFEDNEFLKRLYPDILWRNPKREAPVWGEDSGIVVKRKSNPREPTLDISGLSDGMKTGMHYRLRVYDDVVTETSVTNPDMIRKTTLAWELSENLGTREGRVWMIGTRYHFGDTYGVLIVRGVKERRHAATHDGTFDGRPVLLTEAEWERKKSRESTAVIAAQQLLNPLAGAETRFDVRWLKFWTVRPKRLNVYILVDPSKGKTARSDLTAMAIIGVDVAQNKYLLDGYRHRMALSRRWELLRNAYMRWTKMEGIESVNVGYEQFGLQTDLEYFEERMMRSEVSFPIEELAWPRQGPKSKEHRIERLEPDFRTGRFMLPAVVEIDDEGNVHPVDPRRKRIAQEVIGIGESWRVAKPIHQYDEQRKVYDLLTGFLEEYCFFPFSPTIDFLDAASRIYDMKISPPIVPDDQPGRGMSVEPEIFADT